MNYQLYQTAFEDCKAMIMAGDYTSDAWSFDADDSNALLGANNWTDYSKWFLGIDYNNRQTKDGYAYPYGKAGKVYLGALRDIVKQAKKAGEQNIADSAQNLLDIANDLNADAAKATRGDKDVALVGTATIKASAATAGPRLATFEMLAYTGGELCLDGFNYPVVVDLTGVQDADKQRPAFRDHDPAKIVGHCTAIQITDTAIISAGVISGGNQWADDVRNSGLNGFPWQASIGAKVLKIEFVSPGQTVTVNGRSFEGPINIARRTSLGEISFVALGADDNTRARVAASKAAKGQSIMGFEAWAKAKGFDPSQLTAEQKDGLMASYTAEQGAGDGEPDGDEAKAAKAAAKAPTIRAAVATSTTDDHTLAIRAAASTETKRINAVSAAAKDHPEIKAKAIEEGWNAERTELEVLRASRKAGPSIHAPNINTGAGFAATGLILAAAASLNGGIREDVALKGLNEQQKNMVAERSLKGLGLHGIMAHVAHNLGIHLNAGPIQESDIKRLLQAERTLDLKADGSGGMSTMSLSGITENILNKAMLQAYGSVDSQVDNLAYQTDTNDFKTFKRYRLTGSGNFTQVGPSGELESMSLQDESYANQVTTQGVILTVTRQILLNDDMGALTQIPTVIGRKAALAREKAVFTALLGNAGSFFGSGNANYLSGGGSALAITSLTSAVQKFLQQKDADGDPILIAPGQLVVPPALYAVAENLFNGANLTVTALTQPAASSGTAAAQTAAQAPNLNQHKGKYTPVVVPYLASTFSLTNASDTGWYLLPSVGDVSAGFAPVQIGYLRGQRTPIIERGEANFNTLGIAMRAYYDFGVALHDSRCAVFAAGA